MPSDCECLPQTTVSQVRHCFGNRRQPTPPPPPASSLKKRSPPRRLARRSRIDAPWANTKAHKHKESKEDNRQKKEAKRERQPRTKHHFAGQRRRRATLCAQHQIFVCKDGSCTLIDRVRSRATGREWLIL